MLECTDLSFLNTVITDDKSWFYGMTQKHYSSHHTANITHHWGHKKVGRCAAMSKSYWLFSLITHMWCIMNMFWEGKISIRSITEISFVPSWCSAPQTTSAYSSQMVHTFLAKHNTSFICKTPYSPDMAPCGFWLLLILKPHWKGDDLCYKKIRGM